MLDTRWLLRRDRATLTATRHLFNDANGLWLALNIGKANSRGDETS
jgi:hypothetical protein